MQTLKKVKHIPINRWNLMSNEEKEGIVDEIKTDLEEKRKELKGVEGKVPRKFRLVIDLKLTGMLQPVVEKQDIQDITALDFVFKTKEEKK